MNRILLAAIFALCFGAAWGVEHLIWDDRPGQGWENSWYPLGNGRLGCMVDGGVKTLKVQFNVDSFWTGDKNITGPVNDGNADRNYASMGAFQNFGELEITFDAAGEATDYHRALDLSRAVYSDRFKVDGLSMQRRIFATQPDDCILIVVRAEGGKLPNIRLKLKGAHDEPVSVAGVGGPGASFAGKLGNGLEYAARADVFSSPKAQVEIVLRAVTGSSSLAAAQRPDTAAMFKRHLAEYRGYYDRCVLDLGSGDQTVPTRVRLARVKQGGKDPALTALQFNFGRYLLIGSSRPGTLPANLQGVWNNRNDPAWHSDYHTNINIQMNYWGVDSANLSECFLPLSDWMMAALPIATEVTRATFPNSRGFAYQTSANHMGGGGWRWNFAGAPWMAAQCYDHYLFTRDRKYLKDVVWPLMKGAAEFLISEVLKERPDGTVVIKNGWSPEHGPREDGVAHDQQITRELFRSILAAAKILKIDDAFTKEVARLEPKLLKDKIGSWGQLQEWEIDRDKKGDQHRHTSHLYAVYPGSTINHSTPELLGAAKVALDGRALTGDAHRSWTWPWRSALWARMGEPDKAGQMLESLLRYNTLDNLFATHPPFQIDGNLGMVAAVGEILLNSEKGKKMPADWPHGSIKGLKTRAGETIDFAW
ncbi:MAG: glycosyl hydrolase family 95 catalytic domain-containing protein [Kiritimatiellia bacterium]